jgi:N6-adenosine-specific RNA methylase IME4
MKDRRVRLSTEDTDLIVSALRARAAMTTGLRRHRISRLAERLAEGQRGNPKWIHSEFSQTHEEDLDPEDLDME